MDLKNVISVRAEYQAGESRYASAEWQRGVGAKSFFW